MKIAIVVPGFDEQKPGGVTNVALRMIRLLKRSNSITVISLANKIEDEYSIRLFKVASFRNKRIGYEKTLDGLRLIRIGAVGSEFEFLRYRQRRNLAGILGDFDIIFVVTGILQFANVIPKIPKPVYIQCATRLKWERKSQYPSMTFFRRVILRMQIPLFHFQEKHILGRDFVFLPENKTMQTWLKNESLSRIYLWYPGTASLENTVSERGSHPQDRHFVSVGRFNEPRKGWSRLVNAYLSAHTRNPNLPSLYLIGWGEFVGEDSLTLELAMKSCPIVVLSNLSDSERDNVVMGASFFLQASHEEGLGLAALEALRFGIPMICSETDGSKEYVIDGLTGKLIHQEPLFESNFADAIIESQTWNYSMLSANATRLFQEKFSDSASHRELIEIISRKRDT